MQFITPYQESWPFRFEEIRRYLCTSISTHVCIYHVGSTSVHNLPAKDIIDIDIACPQGSLDEVIRVLAQKGYEHVGDQGILTREAFKPVSPVTRNLPVHHLYACEEDSPELARHLAFRDYLRSHANRAQWLGERKIAHDGASSTRRDYIERKSKDYELIIAEATRWRSGE